MTTTKTTTQKTILITGATAGIGRDAALTFAKLGHKVFATGRREEQLAALKQEAQGLDLHTLRLDVTSEKEIARAREQVMALTDGHGLDVLVNNAGYGLIGPLDVLSDADVRKQFDTNVFGLLAMTRAFVPEMRARGAGRIVHVGSMGGKITFPFMGAYNATKYALESLSDAMRLELRPFGISVSLIEPGAINTEFNGVAVGTMQKYQLENTVYAPIAKRADEVQRRFEKMAATPATVTKVIGKAAFSRWPRARYTVPFVASLTILMFKLLPTRWMDAALAFAMGLRLGALKLPAGVPAPASVPPARVEAAAAAN
jgi:short-subunit dehydrogenase